MYDEFASPPNFQMAFDHAIARRVCKQKSEEIELQQMNQQSRVCPCCNLPIENEVLSLDCEVEEFCHLGITFPLYFKYIKKCSILFTFQIFLSSIVDLYLNMNANTCQYRYSENFICISSVLNILSETTSQSLEIQSLTNFLTLLVLIVAIELFKVRQRIEEYNIDHNQIYPADFTLEISGFNKDVQISEIEHFLQTSLVNTPVDTKIEISKIYYIFSMDEFVKLYKQKTQLHYKRNILNSQLRQLVDKQGKQSLIDKYDFDIKAINIELADVDAKIADFSSTLQHFQSLNQEKDVSEDQLNAQNQLLQFSGRVLVTLNNSYNCKLFIKEWKRSNKETYYLKLYKKGILKDVWKPQIQRFIYQDQLLKIKRASEPDNYVWKNIGSSIKKTKIRRIINLCVFIIFGLSFTILVFLKRAIKEEQEDSTNQYLQIGLSFVASTIVAGSNTLIGIFLRKFTGMETHKRQTSYFIQVGRRLSYLFFINMVLTTLFSNMVALSLGITNQIGFPFNLQQLIYDFFFLFITNTYLSSIFNYFDIVWGFKLYKRWRTLKNEKYSSLSQQQANQLFEGHKVDMALRYANVQKVMFFTAAVSPYLPIGVLLSLIGLLTCYWFDKYLLLRRYIVPFYMDKRLAFTMVSMLPLYTVSQILLFFSIGNLLVMCIPILNQQSIRQFQFPSFYQTVYFYISIFGVIIALIYKYKCFINNIQFSFISDIEIIQQWYFNVFQLQVPKKSIPFDYQHYQSQFKEDYQNYHPPTKYYYKQDDSEFKNAPDLLKTIKYELNYQ